MITFAFFSCHLCHLWMFQSRNGASICLLYTSSLDSKSENSAEAEMSDDREDTIATESRNETIDFSRVKIEPLFEEQVDFDTFSKSDFRAVKVKACEAVKKSKKLLQFTLCLLYTSRCV